MSSAHNPPRAIPVPRIPERVGRYDILMPIASGGMATVYLARPTETSRDIDREVALKLTHPHLRKEKQFVHHLVEEAKLAAGIHHPNVVPILDVGDDPLGIYLVMEYIDGDSLGNLIRLGRKGDRELSVSVGLRILLDGLAGLHAAHDLPGADGQPVGLVHRDFTPQNLLVGLDGVSRLTDFGIAKAATRLGHTATGIVKGKIAYMSPEQARGKFLDKRADVFSAGVVAWELIADRRLHDCETDVMLLLKVATEQAPPLSQVVSGISPDLEQAVAFALMLDHGQRCPSALEFADRLAHAAAQAGMLASHRDVAKEVQAILGDKIERRQQKIQENSAHRSKRRDSATDAVLTDSYTPSSRIPAPLESGTPPPNVSSAPWAALHTPIPVDVALQSDPSVRAYAQVPATPANMPASGEVTVSSSSPRNNSAKLGIAITVGAIVALGVILPLAFIDFGDAKPPDQSHTPATSVPVSILPIASISTVKPEPSAPPPSSAVEPMPDFRTIEVSSNAKISGMTLGGKILPIEEPSANMTVEVEDQSDGSVRGVATSVDGRTTKIRLEPGQRRMRIWFAERAVSIPATGKTDSPIPLAPNPYGR